MPATLAGEANVMCIGSIGGYMDLLISGENGDSYIVSEHDLVVAVDETGDESFKDKLYPLFGMSACLVMGSEYESDIHMPWSALKELAGLNESDTLHASEIDINNQELVSNLGRFFKNGVFGRIAIGCSEKTKFGLDISPVDLCVKMLYENLRKASNVYRPKRIFLLFESCSRLNSTYKKYFMENKLHVRDAGVETIIGRVDKKQAFAPIEVADFICHAHGNDISRQLTGNAIVRRDALSVFARTNSRYCFNEYITAVN